MASLWHRERAWKPEQLGSSIADEGFYMSAIKAAK